MSVIEQTCLVTVINIVFNIIVLSSFFGQNNKLPLAIFARSVINKKIAIKNYIGIKFEIFKDSYVWPGLVFFLAIWMHFLRKELA